MAAPEKPASHPFLLSRRAVWIAVVCVAAATRLLDLGRQSPWLDEILSWQIADKYGFSFPRNLHPLTYWFQALGLMISDSTWGLRLSSAVFGILAVVAATAWALWRFGRLHALCVGLALALSPFAIFYSQDANHYGPLILCGVLAVVSVDWFLERSPPRWSAFVLSVVFVGVCRWFHPIAAFAAAALALSIVFWYFDHAPNLPPKGFSPRLKRLLFLLVIVSFSALAAGRSGLRLFESQGIPQPNERPVGLHWDFLSALLADFFGALFHHRAPDVVLGTSGLILSALGWAWVARRTPAKRAAGAALLTVILTTLPFFALRFSHYFAPRYMIAALPALLMGIACLFAESLRYRKSSTTGFLLWSVIAVWSALFLVRFGTWEVHRLRHDHQPTFQALRWFRDNTPPGAVLATRHVYSSRAIHFLWGRFEMKGKTHVAVSHLPDLGAPSIQQVKELIQESGRPVYFLSLIENEDLLAADFSHWIDNSTSEVARFESGSPDDFAPIDWGITIRKVETIVHDPFDLPRNGASASTILHEDQVRGRLIGNVPVLEFPAGTGASYRIRIPDRASGLTLSIRNRTGGDKESPRWLVAGFEDGPMWLCRPDSSSSSDAAILLEGDLPSGVQRFDIAVAGGILSRDKFEGGVIIDNIRIWDGNEIPGVLVGRTLAPCVSSEPVSTNSSTEAPWSHKDSHLADLIAQIPFRRSIPIGSATWNLRKTPAAGSPLVVVQRLWPSGLGDRAVGATAETTNGTVIPVLLPLDWSYSQVMAAGVLSNPPLDGAVTESVTLGPFFSVRPWTSELVLEPPELYRVANPEP